MAGTSPAMTMEMVQFTRFGRFTGHTLRVTWFLKSRHFPKVPGKAEPPKDVHAERPAQAFSTSVWMPHSVLPWPRQRPARTSSPVWVRLVQGMQPTDAKPFAAIGWRGRPRRS
jgi:hypothetical protein